MPTVLDFMESKENYHLVRAIRRKVDKISPYLPYQATQSVSNMLECLREVYEREDERSYEQEDCMFMLDVMMTGIGLFNLAGRQLWFDLFNCALYSHERLYKLRKLDSNEYRKLQHLPIPSFKSFVDGYIKPNEKAVVCRWTNHI